MVRAARMCCLLLSLLAACTQDFSAFGFQQPRGTTRRDPARTPDAATAPGTESDASDPSQPTPSPDAAAVTPRDAPAADAAAPDQPRQPEAASAGRAAPTPDVPNHPAEHVDGLDAGQIDDAGGPALDMECTARWNALPFGTPVASDASDLPASPPGEACRSCACDACASLILDCLQVGSPEERGLCRDLLTCALRERCQEQDCYCSSNGCNFRASIGDGPCSEEINAAARGTRGRVNALLNANPPDRNEPLIRGTQAIACLFGVHPSSPGPTLSGACEAQCE